MKKICLLLMAAIATNLFAQTLTVEQVANCTDPKNELLKEYQAYTASDGHTYAVGDDITIGVPSSNKTCAFLTSELAMFAGGPTGVAAAWSGYKMKIRTIGVDRNKKRGPTVSMRCYLAGLGGILVKFENALAAGEIVSEGMTREKALDEIKRAKDMLELELITQQEFDSIKAECIKYIK